MKTNFSLLALVLCCLGMSATAEARTVRYDLTLAQTDGPDKGGQKAMTINGGMPGPILRFTEGDDAVLTVRNNLREDTSIHWHGLLVPNDQDGVPHVNMAPIKPGATREYRFRLRQTGTFWYHSHSALQEQLGIYGSIVILPKGGERIRTDHDYVAVLSDWTDENPLDVLTQLRAGRDWQGIKKGTAQSWLGAVRSGQAGTFLLREFNRMPPMDLSDVAYRHFLLNGAPEATLEANAGETVRVRLVNASTATYYFIEFAAGSAKIISADGGDVQPVAPGRFLMATAETYDLLIKVPGGGSYELRATAQDGSGKTSLFIGKGSRRLAPDVPRANLYAPMNMAPGAMDMAPGAMDMDPDAMAMEGEGDGPEEGMEGMPGMDMPAAPTPARKAEPSAVKEIPGPEKGMEGMEGMDMPAADTSRPKGKTPAMSRQEKSATNGMPAMPGMDMGQSAPMAPAQGGGGMTDPERPGTPYEQLRAIRSTRLTDNRPLREYTFRLQGDMIRFVWTLDGKTISEADTVNIRRGERVRFTFVNETMMHHPMHLHGHFFRVLTGAGDFSPLKHTVDVPPNETRIIEFAADEPGDWMMHCHVLYHLAVGMARVIHYEDAPANPHLMGGVVGAEHDPVLFFGEGLALSNMSEGFATLQNNRSGLMATWEIGWQNVDKTGYQFDLTYDRYLNTFTSVFAGAEFDNGESGHRGILGVRYLLPLLIQSQAWVDTKGDFRLSLRHTIPLTPRLALYGGVEYDTLTRWEGVVGVEYVLDKRFSLISQWHSEYGLGGGVAFRF